MNIPLRSSAFALATLFSLTFSAAPALAAQSKSDATPTTRCQLRPSNDSQPPGASSLLNGTIEKIALMSPGQCTGEPSREPQRPTVLISERSFRPDYSHALTVQQNDAAYQREVKRVYNPLPASP